MQIKFVALSDIKLIMFYWLETETALILSSVVRAGCITFIVIISSLLYSGDWEKSVKWSKSEHLGLNIVCCVETCMVK